MNCSASNFYKNLCDNNDCNHCFEKSLTSHPKAKHWNKEKNGDITPRQIRRNNQKKYWFDCETCNHSFQTRPNAINYGSWCIYCAHLKLCDNENCTTCFEKSFASTEKSKLWHPTKNETLTPRQVFKKSTIKYWFKCDKCSHDFYTVTQRGCSYCSNDTLCYDSCDICFQRSFASHPKSKFWNHSLNGDVKPRDMFKNSNKKFWFACDDCGLDFHTNLLNVAFSNNWCPAHKNVTEKMLLRFLMEKLPAQIQLV
jgi:hypothetical protein